MLVPIHSFETQLQRMEVFDSQKKRMQSNVAGKYLICWMVDVENMPSKAVAPVLQAWCILRKVDKGVEHNDK